MAGRIARHRTDRAVFHIGIEPGLGMRFQLFELAQAFGRGKPGGIDRGNAVIARKVLGPRARQEYVRACLHHRARQLHRVARARYPGNSPRAAGLAIHDRRIKLVGAVIGEHRAAPGIEMRIILQRGHGHGYGIDGAATIRQHRAPGIERSGQPRPMRGDRGGIQGVAGHRSGTAVDRDCPTRWCIGHGAGRYQVSGKGAMPDWTIAGDDLSGTTCRVRRSARWSRCSRQGCRRNLWALPMMAPVGSAGA